jgi:C4-dicarboxylate transporter, DctM subunit
MMPELIGLAGIALLLLLLALGAPIGIGLMFVGLGGLAILISPEAAVIKLGVLSFGAVSRYELGVLPLFLLMAHLCFAAGASRDFFSAAAAFLGHRRGGLALASIGGCAGFGAISGSSLATVATVSSVALPEMRRANYDPGFAAGALAAGGTLGSLVPPSGALIVFGIISEQSIGKLFAASIVPGATQAIFYLLTILLLCTWKPELGPRAPRLAWRDRVPALRRIVDIMILILFVIGGLMLGWFTPTEAASVGVVGAILLWALRGGMTMAKFGDALARTLRTTGMIYLVIIGAMLFATFISASEITESLSQLVLQAHASPTLAIVLMALVLLVLGSFLDGLALMLLTTPIFLPIAHDLGFSAVWFGIFLVRTMEIGFVHPPLGLNVYVIHGIASDIPLARIFRGIIPFLFADFVHLACIIAFPAMTLWLPSLLGAK